MRNGSDSMILATERALEDLGDKVSEDDKKEAEELKEDLKKALEGSDIDEIKEKTEKLNKKAMELAAKVYEQNAPKEDAETKKDDDDAEEATYEEKNN